MDLAPQLGYALDASAISLLCGAFISLAINGTILYWFITNRTLFGSYTTKTVMGPDGEIVKERVRSSEFDVASAIVIVGMIAIFCLIPFVTIFNFDSIRASNWECLFTYYGGAGSDPTTALIPFS